MTRLPLLAVPTHLVHLSVIDIVIVFFILHWCCRSGGICGGAPTLAKIFLWRAGR